MSRTQIKYLDPKNDLTFRKIFGEHPHIMKSFLNSVMPFEDDRYIETLVYQDPAMIPELPEFKHSVVDVKCTDNYGRQFIVEMQMYWTSSFKSRMLFNSGKAYVKQLDRGGKYDALCPVYGLSLVNAIFLTDEKYKDEYYHHYRMLHSEISEEVIEGIELVFIELPKFKAKTFTEKKLRNLWLRFLTEIDENTQNVPEDLLKDSDIKDALERLQVSAFDKAELAYYDKYWDSVRVEQARIADVRKKYAALLSKNAKELEELRQREKEAKRKEEEARKEKEKAKQREAEAKQKEAEAKRKEEEAKREKEEAKQKEAEAKQKERTAKLKLAQKMLQYGEPLESIMQETGLTENEIKNNDTNI